MKDFLDFIRKSRFWKDRFVTLLVIPERTRRVHRMVLPFFLMKFGIGLSFLLVIFLMILGMDYIHVLGRVAENKRLKGENFKLRQEIQQIKNKVDSMESTVERVRNYAKKLQILTGQQPGDKSIGVPLGPLEDEEGATRAPSSIRRGKKTSKVILPSDELMLPSSSLQIPLEDRMVKLENTSVNTESDLSVLQSFFLTQKDLASATPSIMPITGWLSSTFGYRRHPSDGSYRLHSGVDIAAELGTPVRSPADGEVIFSGLKEGYGKVIVINHKYGIHTIYGHNSELFVNIGDHVKRNQIISKVGSTGKSTGSHLHYEVRKWGKPIDPLSLVGGRL